MSKSPMGPGDRDRAIDEALAGRASTGHSDLEGVAAFAAQLRAKAAHAPVRPSPALVSLLRGESDLAPYVELAAGRGRRRPALIWAAAVAVAVALGGVAVAQPWQRGGPTPTAASVTDTVAMASITSVAPATAPPIVTTTEMSLPATTAATVPPVTIPARPTKPATSATASSSTVKTRPPEPPVTTASSPPPPPPPGLDAAKARWRACATGSQQEGLTQDQVKARCGAEPNLDGYRGARATWETCLRAHPRSGPTAICGPEPDPAAYGFVPPVWQKP